VRQLERAGLKWTAKKLCTVRAARNINQDCPYSLGRLCDSLNINLDNRHRAGGDADATAILFSRLLEWDTDKEMDKMIKKPSDHDYHLIYLKKILSNYQIKPGGIFYEHTIK
jgi:DNA polymerase-3 subunit epsilon